MKVFKQTTFTVILVIAFLLALSPIGYQKASAQSVTVVGDTSLTNITTSIKATLSAALEAVTAAETAALTFKETVLDPLAWLQSKEMQKQLISEYMKWLGGQANGQNGEVPFVRNLSDYYRSIADQVAGQYLFVNQAGDSGQQCNEEYSHEVRTLIYNDYLTERKKSEDGGALNQCVKDDDEEGRGAYKSLLHKQIGDVSNCRDELCGGFVGKRERLGNELAVQLNETKLLDYGRGMLPQKRCTTINDPDGRPLRKCEVVTPPSIAPDTTSYIAGILPFEQLLDIDEFNEVASNLLSNLTNQIFGSVNGLLGLTGNPSYSANVFGASGNLSYAQALADEDISQYQSLSDNQIKESLEAEEEYVELQQEIIDEVEELEEELERNEEEFPSCFDLELTEELEEAKETAESNIRVSTTTIQILVTLDSQYENATDGATKSAVMSTYQTYKAQGLFRTKYENQELELSYINLEFAEMVDEFRYDTAVERYQCGGDFNYDGNAGDSPEDEEDEDSDNDEEDNEEDE